MSDTSNIKLYGTQGCHKTRYYQSFFEDKNIDYQFLDVLASENFAVELGRLYKNRKLNFPTITINHKKLRNPSDTDLNKWLIQLK